MTDFAPSVLLIYTGGTIGMIENPETGALESFNFDHLLNFVPELKRFNYHINTYSFDPPIDSSDMEPYHWARLARIVERNYEQYDGFVILHGTDTMAYTASALSFMLENLSKTGCIDRFTTPDGYVADRRQRKPDYRHRDCCGQTSGRYGHGAGSLYLLRKRLDEGQPYHENQCREI